MKIFKFLQDQLPNGATHCDQSECGFSIYRNVLVQWDEDHDERVLWFLDRLPVNIIEKLLVCQEHEGTIEFLWKGKVPKGFEEGGSVNGDGDEWNISGSTAITSTL